MIFELLLILNGIKNECTLEKITGTVSKMGGIGFFGFAVSANFLHRFFGVCTKQLRFFGFGDHCVFAVSVLFRSRFSVFVKNKIGFSDLLFHAIWCFSGFSSENVRLNYLNRVHVSSDFACAFRF